MSDLYQKMVVSGAATPDTGKAEDAQKIGNTSSVVNRSGIGKQFLFTPTIGDDRHQHAQANGLYRNGATMKLVTGRAARREAERKAAKAARKGGVK